MLPPLKHRALFVDFNGTVCFDHFWRSSSASVQQAARDLLFSGDVKLVENWMCGTISSEAVNRLVAEHAGVDADALWVDFIRDCQTMRVKQSVFEGLYVLRDRYRLIMITDNMDCFNRFTVPALRLDHVFHHVANSCDYGLLKKQDHGRFFKQVAEECHVDLAQSFLLDDCVDTCQVFASVGGSAHRVRTPECAEDFISALMLRG